MAELCEALVCGDLVEERVMVKGWFGPKVVQEIEAGQAKGKRVYYDKKMGLMVRLGNTYSAAESCVLASGFRALHLVQ